MNSNHHAAPAAILFNCAQSPEDARLMNAFISEGYMRLKPLLYPCTIEFSLMSLTVNKREKMFQTNKKHCVLFIL